jgi:glycosyltransferase involved in cell wall biosynthesis
MSTHEKRPAILVVTTVAGSAHAFLYPYADLMRARGWRVDLATSEAEDRPEVHQHYDRVIPMTWRRTLWALRDNFRAVKEVQRVLGAGGYDIVHTHTPIASFLVRLAAAGIPREKRPAIIYTAHGFHFHRNGDPTTNLAYKSFEKIAGWWTDYLVVINEEDRVAAEKLHIVPPQRLLLIPGIGVDFATYCRPRDVARRRTELRTRLGIPQDAPVVVAVAEFIPRKRHLDLFHAIAGSGRRDWHILLAGEGRLDRELRDLVAELGIADRCHFLGYVRDVPGTICCADVMSLPSEQEGLPRAVMEAMAVGVPVVGANARGTRDLLEDNCGLIHPVGDVARLRTYLERVVASPVLRECLVNNARRKVVRFDLRPLLEIHERLYETALKRGNLERPSEQASDAAVLDPLPPRAFVAGAAIATLVNIRSPIMRAMQAAGWEVVAIASDRDEVAEQKLLSWGIRYYYIPMARTGLSPITDTRYLLLLSRLINLEQPALVLGYTHKPVLYTALARAFLRSRTSARFYALITGLGYAFTDDAAEGKGRRNFVRKVLLSLYRAAARQLSGIMFQNVDDAAYFNEIGLLPKALPQLVVRGSGIELERFPLTPIPAGPVRFVFIARLLAYKGVREFVAAARIIQQRRGVGSAAFEIVGPYDPNPAGIQPSEVAAWVKEGIVDYAGGVDDVRPFLRGASVYVLPSYYREGTPRTVLEAMATGRAIITAETPGCRETIFSPGEPSELGVRRGENGFLVPRQRAEALAAAMEAFLTEPSLAHDMGQASRRLAEQYYDVRIINRHMMRFMGFTLPEPSA